MTTNAPSYGGNLTEAAAELATWTTGEKLDVINQIIDAIRSGTPLDQITIDLPGCDDVPITEAAGTVIFQEFLQQLANIIEEMGQLLGLSDKEIKELKQLLGVA